MQRSGRSADLLFVIDQRIGFEQLIEPFFTCVNAAFGAHDQHFHDVQKPSCISIGDTDNSLPFFGLIDESFKGMVAGVGGRNNLLEFFFTERFQSEYLTAGE